MGAKIMALTASFIHLVERISGTVSTVATCRKNSATSSSRPAVEGSRLPKPNHDLSRSVFRRTIPGMDSSEPSSTTHPSVRDGPTIPTIASTIIPFYAPTSSPSGWR